MLSIPIRKPHIQPIRAVRFVDQEWKKKHLRTILQAYGLAPFFKDYFPTLVEIICAHPYSLERLNVDLTGQMATWLGVTTPTVEGADFSGDAVDKIIQMCHAVDADRYLSNEGARDYLSPTEEDRLEDSGIWHNWMEDWKDPDEEPLSAIHHLFTLGPDAARLIQ